MLFARIESLIHKLQGEMQGAFQGELQGEPRVVRGEDGERRCHLAGWWLFVGSAVFFIVAGVRAGDVLTIVGGVLFLLGCVLFLYPLARCRPADSEAHLPDGTSASGGTQPGAQPKEDGGSSPTERSPGEE